MSGEQRELLERMVKDLSQMVPARITYEILDDSLKLSNGRPWSCGTVMDWMTPCQLAEWALSYTQDFVADICSQWWPMVGHKRLGYRINCVDGRPELALFL